MVSSGPPQSDGCSEVASMCVTGLVWYSMGMGYEAAGGMAVVMCNRMRDGTVDKSGNRG